MRLRSKIRRLDIQSRGSYILDTALVELNMTEAIANHFFVRTDPKRPDLLSILWNHDFSFRSKEIIYRAMLIRCYPDLWKKYSSDINKLKGIAEYRNMLAHWGSIRPRFGADMSKVDFVTLYHMGKPEKLRCITKQLHKAKLEELWHLCSITETIAHEIERRHPTSRVRNMPPVQIGLPAPL
jgi:hypothetical protein